MSSKPKGIGNRVAPARFIAFVAILIAVTGAALLLGKLWQHAVMAGFDIAALVFLVLLAPRFRVSEARVIREQAAQNDANRVTLLVITGVVMVVILVAVASELAGDKDWTAKSLILGTLTLAWLFSNTIYAFHYAHLYYSPASEGGSGKDAAGIEFPKTKEPDYWDFVYFSYTLGMTFQTSDTDITDGRIRRLATVHSLAAFIFNLGVIAFTINVLGSSSSGG